MWQAPACKRTVAAHGRAQSKVFKCRLSTALGTASCIIFWLRLTFSNTAYQQIPTHVQIAKKQVHDSCFGKCIGSCCYTNIGHQGVQIVDDVGTSTGELAPMSCCCSMQQYSWMNSIAEVPCDLLLQSNAAMPRRLN